jgi:hypothetical protein
MHNHSEKRVSQLPQWLTQAKHHYRFYTIHIKRYEQRECFTQSLNRSYQQVLNFINERHQ